VTKSSPVSQAQIGDLVIISAVPLQETIGKHQFIGIVIDKRRKMCRISWSGPMAGGNDNHWHVEDSLQIISEGNVS
jgi:hypothetical protein